MRPKRESATLSSKFAAPQHGPRPLPLFLQMVQERTAGDPARLAQILEGLRRYQDAPRTRRPRGRPVVARIGGATLRDYGGDGPDVVFIPSLINPPDVLDLGRRSLLKWLARQGRRVLLVDWGPLADDRRGLSVSGHVERILLPMMAALPAPPDLVGYCLGGTMAVAAAQLGRARSLATIAAPWHYDGYGPGERARLAELWTASGEVAGALDLMPMEVLQQGFWSLDPDRTIGKYASFALAEGQDAADFVALEDWANDGPPLPLAAAREMFEDLIAADMTGRGAWQVGGQAIAPERLACPLLNIVSLNDRIVPAGTAIRTGERIELGRGHVGMVVGSRAREELWRPLAAWLGRVSPACGTGGAR